MNKGVIARFHDESYLNKYLLDKEPHIVGNEYTYYPATIYKGNFKAELIDKATIFGHDKLFDIRDEYFQADLSFLLDENGKFNRLGIISMAGGLGNQLFIVYIGILFLSSRSLNSFIHLTISKLSLKIVVLYCRILYLCISKHCKLC